jgi:hypothetical protein
LLHPDRFSIPTLRLAEFALRRTLRTWFSGAGSSYASSHML